MKLKKVMVLTILMLMLPVFTFAEEFKGIKIDASIDENGIAKVNEVWQIDEDNEDYTERYKLINNLRGIKD